MSMQELKARAAQKAGQITEETVEGTDAAEVSTSTELETTQSDIPDRATQNGWFTWVKEYRGYWRQLLPPYLPAEAFELSALSALLNSKQIMQVARDNPASIVHALSMCAHFGLMPDGVQAAVVPYGSTVQFIPMYRGYLTLLQRHKVIKTPVFDHVREGDTVELDKGKPAPDDFTHRVNMLAEIPDGQSERTPLVAYCYAWLPDGSRTEVVTMSRKRAEAIRDQYSKAYQQAEKNRKDRAEEFARNPRHKDFNSPWHTPTGEISEAMWLKSVVRLWVKRLDITPYQIGELISADVADDSTGQQVVTPAKVIRVLTTAPAQSASEPHPYVHDDATDPFCGLEGCSAYHNDEIHNA